MPWNNLSRRFLNSTLYRPTLFLLHHCCLAPPHNVFIIAPHFIVAHLSRFMIFVDLNFLPTDFFSFLTYLITVSIVCISCEYCTARSALYTQHVENTYHCCVWKHWYLHRLPFHWKRKLKHTMHVKPPDMKYSSEIIK